MDEPPSYTILNLLSDQSLVYPLGAVAIVVLLILSAWVAACEAAFFALTPEDLDAFKASTSKREQEVAALLTRPRVLLTTLLIVNRLSNIGIATLVAFMWWQGYDGFAPTTVWLGVAVVMLAAIVTLGAELVPKSFAARHRRGVARRVVYSWKFLTTLCLPLFYPLMKMSTFVEQLFEKKNVQTTVEELNEAIELAGTGKTSAGEKEILRGIVNFGTLTVKQIMRPRPDISAVSSMLNFHELMTAVTAAGYSRIPVYHSSLDTIQGVLYIKDLLPFLEQPAEFDWHTLVRPGYFVPEIKKIDVLLKEFQEKRVHIALAVNEYGGISGLITLEDIIEEIIGDINDEFDEVNTSFHRVDDTTYVFEGKTSIHDFCKTLDIDRAVFSGVQGESESLGGLLVQLHHEIPKTGDQISFDQLTFVVESVDRKRIKRVRVHVHAQA